MSLNVLIHLLNRVQPFGNNELPRIQEPLQFIHSPLIYSTVFDDVDFVEHTSPYSKGITHHGSMIGCR